MKKIIIALLAFLALVGCRTKKVETHTQRQVQKEHFITYKDSSQLFAYQGRKTDLSEQSEQSFELELESLTDSVGNPRELIYTRIRDGDNEVIRVLNGKVKIKATNTHSKSHQQADSTLYIDNKIIKKKEEKILEISHKKQEEKQVEGTHWWSITWVIIISLILFVAWRMKLF